MAGRVVQSMALAVVAVSLWSCAEQTDAWRERAEEMTAAAEAKLASVSARIDSLQESALTATAEAREDIEKELGDLEEKERQAAEKLEELKSATKESWQELRRRFDSEMEKLEKAFEEIQPDSGGSG
jgi:DNA anti-recombination protein RmuC